MPLRCGFLPDDAIAAAAGALLAEHHPALTIPVPIEEIVEFGLGIEIRPFRGLRERFGFEGALTRDLRTIVVDEGMMDRRENRYRFTLAHEVGHLVLHGELIAAAPVTDKRTWRDEVRAIDSQSYAHMEHQAYRFAGCTLAPAEPLRRVYAEMHELAMARGIDLSAMGEEAFEHVAPRMAKVFRVSRDVIARRLRAEGMA